MTRIRIGLGSKSEPKLAMVRSVLDRFIQDYELVGIDVDSGVSDQPLSVDETVKGAINRARNAQQADDLEFSIGLEGGLEPTKDTYQLVCTVAICGPDGVESSSAYGPFLPKEVADVISNGGQFGIAIREYQAKENNADIEELVSREQTLKKAIDESLARFIKN